MSAAVKDFINLYNLSLWLAFSPTHPHTHLLRVEDILMYAPTRLSGKTKASTEKKTTKNNTFTKKNITKV